MPVNNEAVYGEYERSLIAFPLLNSSWQVFRALSREVRLSGCAHHAAWRKEDADLGGAESFGEDTARHRARMYIRSAARRLTLAVRPSGVRM